MAYGMQQLNMSDNQQEGPRFFPAFEHIAVGIAYVSLDGRWLDVNQQVCDICGYTPEELKQLTFQAITYPEDLEKDVSLLHKVIRKEIPTYAMEKRYIRKDRSLIWVKLTVTLVCDEQQQPAYLITTIENIQARKQIEEEQRMLLEREATARKQLEHSNEQLLVLQAITDTVLTHLNLDALFQSILSRIMESMRADNIAVLLFDETRQYLRVRAVLGIEESIAPEVRIAPGQGFAGTIVARRKPLIVDENSSIEVLNPVLRSEIRSLLGVPLTVNEQIIGVVHIGTRHHRTFTEDDIELLQRVADRLALAIERVILYEHAQRAHHEAVEHASLLEQMYEQQNNFVSIVSHEFRTTLTGIQGFSDLLRKEQFSPWEVHEFANDIYRDSLRLLRMINDLLDLEKMKDDRSSMHPERFDFAEIVKAQVHRFQSVTYQHVLHLELDDAPLSIEGDKDKLSQVIANLLSNAIKYSPTSNNIYIRCCHEGNVVHLEIEDQGLGIPSSALDKIFDTYNRIHSERTRYIQGTGLGLAIVKQIVHLHHGQVWVESTLGEGSTFHVVLPL